MKKWLKRIVIGLVALVIGAAGQMNWPPLEGSFG